MRNISTANSHCSFSKIPHSSSICFTWYVYIKNTKIWNKIKIQNHRQIKGTRYTIQHVHQNSFVPLYKQQYPYIKLLSKKIYVKVFFVFKKPSSFSPEMIECIQAYLLIYLLDVFKHIYLFIY